MDEPKRENKLLSFLSGLMVLGAVVLLVHVCGSCYPAMEHQVRQVLGGLDQGPAKQAFHVMAEGLESGESIKETLQDTVQVLFGEAD